MKNKAVFLKCTHKVAISKMVTPEFYRLYLQSAFLNLKEQGFLNDVQYQYCLNSLNHKI